MIELQIPGKEIIRIEHLVVDYNGTLAVGGDPLSGCLDRLRRLAERVEVHVVTADTFGRVASHVDEQAFKLEILPVERQDEAKASYVRDLGLRTTAAIGNGANDARMLREAALGLAVVQAEGAAAAAIQNADAVFTHINDALDALLDPKRLVATLRT
ncbi:MAG: HAD hydrolase family protein [Candidatus Krumholzibacteria bacterium]|nr:HAD hydrolase family protein [Candidatus Krumholzibacteria bacterium]